MKTRLEDEVQGNGVFEQVSHHELRVGILPTAIRMRIYRKPDGKLRIEQSHFIKTGIQYLPYAVNEFQSLDESATVRELESKILGFYDQAIRRGYTPSECWLVPNSSFHDL
jgi:hypothetical protein